VNGVVALLSDLASERELSAGFEEEGVPLELVEAEGDALALAREAARRSALGLGVGGDAERLLLVLAPAPALPYLESEPGSARAFARAAARVAARRPV
jgi:hypothetical protein